MVNIWQSYPKNLTPLFSETHCVCTVAMFIRYIYFATVADDSSLGLLVITIWLYHSTANMGMSIYDCVIMRYHRDDDETICEYDESTTPIM